MLAAANIVPDPIDHDGERERPAKSTTSKVGAHPGLLGLQDFGRGESEFFAEGLIAITIYQVGACKDFSTLKTFPCDT